MKRVFSILLLMAMVVSLVPSVTFAVDKEIEDLTPTGNEEDKENIPLVIPLGLEEFQEIAPASFTIPPGATVFNIPNYAEFDRVRLDELRGSSAPAVAVMRITGNINYTSSGALAFTHPNLYIVAGPGNYRIFTSTNGFLVANSGANIRVGGGSEGGSLRIEGDSAHGPGMVLRGGNVEFSTGVSLSHYRNGGIQVDSGTFTLSGATIHHNRCDTTGSSVLGGGGGIRVNGGRFIMTSGLIQYNTAIDGGGIHVAGGQVNLSGGQISNNFSVNNRRFDGTTVLGRGGGLYAPVNNLGNITIGTNVRFLNNVAESGIRINNALAEQYKNTIHPSTVTVTDLGSYLTEDGTFIQLTPHAFTNYDIGTDATDAPQIWRVSYRTGGGNGTVVAQFATTHIEIPSGTYVQEGTEVLFVPDPAALLEKWEIGTKLTDTDQDGWPIPYQYTHGGAATPLTLQIKEHTDVIGYFSKGYTITKYPNDGVSPPFIRMVAAGTHTLTHVPTHPDETMTFIGWSRNEDGSGMLYETGDPIEIFEDTPLYAVWQPGTTTLTISKEVTGDFANKVMDFEFTIFFKDSTDAPLGEYTTFNYTGDILPGSGAVPPAKGVLTLDNTGSATFKLKHGQTIQIEEVPIGFSVQIIETIDVNYITSYVIEHSEVEVIVLGNDTGSQLIESNPVFRCINERDYVPATGLATGHSGAMLLLLALLTIPALALFFMRIHFIRATTKKERGSPSIG